MTKYWVIIQPSGHTATFLPPYLPTYLPTYLHTSLPTTARHSAPGFESNKLMQFKSNLLTCAVPSSSLLLLYPIARPTNQCYQSWSETSVARVGDVLHFGQLFKACVTKYFAQIAHILDNFCKGFKIFHFCREINLSNFYRHLATFYWSHWLSETHFASIFSLLHTKFLPFS